MKPELHFCRVAGTMSARCHICPAAFGIASTSSKWDGQSRRLHQEWDFHR
jgi:hypothetical protein